MDETTASTARRVRVRGRVQGVFFRASLQELAQRHGVTGWVANLSDGSVQAWVEGPSGGVDAVVGWVTDGGPPSARITGLEIEDVEPAQHQRFEIRG